MRVPFVPRGYPAVFPVLDVRGAAALRDFLVAVFAARIREWEVAADGTLLCAEAWIGESCLLVGEARPPHGVRTAAVWVYVPDVDACHARALAAGAASVAAPADQYYGDRKAGVLDPFGNLWWIGTHIEDLTPEEIHRQAREYVRERGGG